MGIKIIKASRLDEKKNAWIDLETGEEEEL